jgi:hypothetical protein
MVGVSLLLILCMLLISQLPQVGWNFQFPGFFWLNYLLPAGRKQTSGEEPVLQGSF